MTTFIHLLFASALNFVLLFGWLDWSSALSITLIDWAVGAVIYFAWIERRVQFPKVVPREIRFPAKPPSSKARLAA